MFCLSFLVFFIYVNVWGLDAKHFPNKTSAQVVTGYNRAAAQPANNDAFSDDFDACMINRWIHASVLKTSPTAACSSSQHSRLCYGYPNRRPNNAQYISCYNTEKLIPEFTAYIVPCGPAAASSGRPNQFRQDGGIYAPNPQAQHSDCNKPPGATGNFFCSRGHLTPNGAFNTRNERDLTFTVTNIAPQWQEFNGGNWAAVEHAVKAYVTAVNHGVYVFTGTAGIAKYWSTVWGFIPWKKPHETGSGRMTVPKYYWKVVCDPNVRESIVFIAENNIAVTSTTKVTAGTCLSQAMTEKKGVVSCYDLSTAQKQYFQNWWHGFKLPDFHATNCGTANRGTFLDQYLKFT